MSTPAPTTEHPDVPPVIASRSNRRRWPWLLVGVLLVGALGVLFSFNPSQHGFYPICVFHRVTGWQCPGCGGLRAMHHLLRGEILTAFQFNQVVVLALPVLAWLGFRRWRRQPGQPRVALTTQAIWGWTILGVLVVFWIVRNLPVDFFKLPAE